MLTPRGRPCSHTVHRGRLLGLSLMVLLLLWPVSVDSLSPKMVLWLIRFKNFRFYNQEKDLFVDSPIPDDLDQRCRQYDVWLDPLIGSSPAEHITPPSFDAEIVEMLEHKTRDNIMRKSNRTLSILAEMLDGYEAHGLFQDWHSATPQVEFVPKMFWRRPWNLEEKPGDLYQLLTTYSRILHYYLCILKNEHNSVNRFQRYSPTYKLRQEIRNFRGGNLKKNYIRALGIDNEGGFEETEVNFFLMMGHVFLKLHNTTRPAVSKLTLDHDVNKAINKMHSTRNIGMRIFYRANLCLELYRFLTEVSDRSQWASVLNDDDVFAILRYAMGRKIDGKKNYENNLFKDYGNEYPSIR